MVGRGVVAGVLAGLGWLTAHLAGSKVRASARQSEAKLGLLDDEDSLRDLGFAVAGDIQENGRGYDRKLVRRLQIKMGLPIDRGIYSKSVADALRRLHVDPPIVPDDVLVGPADPRLLAKDVADDLTSTAASAYDRALLRRFQREVGLTDHGLFTGEERGALIAFGIPAYELPTPYASPRETIPYFGAEHEATLDDNSIASVLEP